MRPRRALRPPFLLSKVGPEGASLSREVPIPTSNLACWPELLALAQTAPHRRVLDVGPGWGKAGILLREYTTGIERLDAVEGWPAYITPRLRCLYDEVIEADVMRLSPEELAAYDLVWMCDVIEHLTHEDGESLLERIRGEVIICTPRDYFQNEKEVAAGIWTEDHRSLWTVEEFQAMPRTRTAYVNTIGAVIALLGPR